jgi:NADPH2:quinone reductase
MKAVVVSEYGPPEVLTLRDVPDPHPGANQVVVAVEAAGVNFVETMRRAGRMPGFGSETLPYHPGNEVGGRIVEIGADVDPALLGCLVVAQPGGTGGYAERIALDADKVIPVPDGLDLHDAVALLAQGRTAIALINQAHLRPGERVLILAAAGGVGSLLVQLARNAGAGTIIAAAHGPRKLDLARHLGAHVAIDYGESDWTARVRQATSGTGVDVAFDGIGGELGRAAFDLLADGTGRMLVFGMSSGRPATIPPDEMVRRGVEVIGLGGRRELVFDDIPGLIRAALREAAAGRLKPIIGQTFPLAAAADAHRAIESRATIGKTLLIP